MPQKAGRSGCTLRSSSCFGAFCLIYSPLYFIYFFFSSNTHAERFPVKQSELCCYPSLFTLKSCGSIVTHSSLIILSGALRNGAANRNQNFSASVTSLFPTKVDVDLSEHVEGA